MLNLVEIILFQESLEEINLEGNNITEIESGTFLSLSRLNNVNLRNNSLKTLPRNSLKVSNSVGKMNTLETLSYFSYSRQLLHLPSLFQPIPL